MTKQLKKDQGFTLVELAIVMIIIGLLIGGVLKGQELINNAQISSVVAEMNGFDAALGGFRDQFRAIPGDIAPAQAQVRIPNCTAAPCLNAAVAAVNANGRIDEVAVNAAPNSGDENSAAWIQLGNANYISGVGSGVAGSWGNIQPATSFGQGGYHISYHAGGALGANAVDDLGDGTASAGHYLVLTLNPQQALTGFLTVAQAARIDRKLDDGTPNTGRVQGFGSDLAGTTPEAYDEANPTVADFTLAVGLSN